MSTIPPKKYPRFSQKWFRQNPVRIFVVAGIAVAFLWAGSAMILWPAYCDIAKRGQFGDQFGAINALFSGLAFAGIVVSLFLQRRDLSLQRRDLKMQRVELQKSREEFEQQNFQSMFFGLMKHQQELLINPTAQISYLKLYSVYDVQQWAGSGHDLFRVLKKQLMLICEALEHEKYESWTAEFANELGERITEGNNYTGGEYDDSKELHFANVAYTINYYEIKLVWWQKAQTMTKVERHRLAYSILLQKFNFILSPYFRHLYHILKYLKASKEEQLTKLETRPKDEKSNTANDQKEIRKQFKSFADFFQAQLSPQVLFLLFHNVLCFEEYLVPLVKEFEVLENLDEEDLGGIKSGEVHGLTFKSRKNLIQQAIAAAENNTEGGQNSQTTT